MIDVRIRREGHRIAEVTIAGHAGFARRGADIVCAAVSAVSIGGANAIERLLGVSVVAAVDEAEEGYLRIESPRQLAPETENKVQLLLQSMVAILAMIAEEHRRHVRITETATETGR